MNRYGALARDHWKKHRPTRYQELEDPERFFTELGEQVADQVQQLTMSLESQQRADLNSLPDLQRLGRLNAIRTQAEEITFAELVWPPEPEPQEPEIPSGQLEQLGATQDEDGALMPSDRQHPLWALWEASTTEDATPAQSEAFDTAYREWLRANPELLA